MIKTVLFFVGFFVASMAAMLFVTGVFQQQIVPLMNGKLPAEVQGEIVSEKLAEFDPDSALAVLQAIEVQREKLKAERDSLESLNARVSFKVEELRSQVKLLAEAEKKHEETVEAKPALNQQALAALAKLYSAMKPADTAEVFKELDDETVVQVLSKMKERQAAKVMELIDAGRAAKLSRIMAFGMNKEM